MKVITKMNRSYQDLIKLKTFEERFDYLKLNGSVGKETFGSNRYFYQNFFKSKEWKRTRDEIIIRDNGCDLGIEDRIITGKLLIHHINPTSMDDISNHNLEILLNPNNLICVSFNTHEAIHYGDESLLLCDFTPRKPNDTKLW